MKFVFFLAFLSILALSSCQKVIDVKLDEGEVLLAVDGWITNQNPPYYVELKTTSPYFANKPAPRASGASLNLTDSEGNTENLTEVSAGKYRINQIKGKIGNKYTLNIQYQGQSYEAKTEIKFAPPIDSVTYETFGDRGPRKAGIYTKYFGPEPNTIGDRYRIKVYINDTLRNKPSDLIVFSDQFVNGSYLEDFDLSFDPFKKSDKMRVEVLAITDDAFNFYNEMIQQINNSGLFATPTANVRTNVINLNNNGRKAVGYFGGSALSFVQGIITDDKGKIVP